MENENEVIDSTNDTETTENEEVIEETQEPEIDVEALKKENATLKAQKEHWKKKAETPKETKEQETQKETPRGLSDEDVLYIAKADIHADDLAELRTFMKNNGKNAKEAHEYLKPIFDKRSEERKTASITHTKGGAKGSSRTTGEDLLRKAENGEFPESDEEIAKMLNAKFEARKNANRRD